MKKLFLLFALGVFSGPDDRDPKQDQAKLQGTWTIESVEVNGMQLAPDTLKALKRVFTGNKFLLLDDGKTAVNGSFTLDTDAMPKAIDLRSDTTNKVAYGIYELDGDTFRLCYALPGVARPRHFTTRTGTGHMLVICKREKKQP